MLKKKTKVFFTLLLFLFSAANVHSALTPIYGNNIVYDDTNNIYWLADMSIFVNQTYGDQITNIGNHTYTDPNNVVWDNWKMASLDEMNLLWAYSGAEIVDSFLPSKPGSTNIYSGRYDLAAGQGHTRAWINDYGGGTIGKSNLYGHTIGDDSVYDSIGAWVVSTVPVPSSFLLFGTSLIGLVRFGRRNNSFIQ